MKLDEIIVVEDNDTMRLGITESLIRAGYKAHAFEHGKEAVDFFSGNVTGIAVVDLKMEPMDGMEVLSKLKKISPETEVLMISAYGNVDKAVKAMRLGASDFLTKPFSPDELRLRIQKLSQKLRDEITIKDLQEHNRLLSDELSSSYGEIIGKSESMHKVFDLIKQVSGNDSTILIQGESGTGKELVAREIHKKSKRNNKPFIRVNCGALNDNLLESELFGHEKGAFTGAIRQKKGRFELANEGSLFLDEIGDVSNMMQIKLLRILQEKEFERVGGEQTLKSDVRIISASNKDLTRLVSENKFRDDLYYRLSVIPILIPPLRERREDIKPLVEHFLKKHCEKTKSPVKKIEPSGMKLLELYNFPGNIRELENLIERLVVISSGEIIDSSLIEAHLGGVVKRNSEFNGVALDDALYSYEKNMIIQAMQKAGGVKNRAAKLLGVKTSALYYKLEKFGLLK